MNKLLISHVYVVAKKKSIHVYVFLLHYSCLQFAELSVGYPVHEADFRDKLPRPRSSSYFLVLVDNITNIK